MAYPAPSLPPRRLVLLGAVVLLTRLPFLLPGYGLDPDAWRLAISARAISESGRYHESRSPGHPVQEVASALVWRAGPLATNGLTALCSVAAALFFALLWGGLGFRHPGWAGLALALTPIVYLHSVDSMDYVWALAFLIGALHASRCGRPVVGGLLLGLATGCRITSLVGLPACLWILHHARSPGPGAGPVFRLLVVAATTSALAYLPNLLAQGVRFLRYAELSYPGARTIAAALTVEIWGVLGCLGLLLSLALAWRARRRSEDEPSQGAAWRSTVRRASLTSLGLVLFAYLLLPADAGYLTAAVPFALLLAATGLPPAALRWFLGGLVVAPFLGDLRRAPEGRASELARPAGGRSPEWAIPLQRLGVPARLVLYPGTLEADRRERILRGRETASVLAAVERLPGRAAVVAMQRTPQLVVEGWRRPTPNATFLWSLSRLEAARWRAAGTRLYFLPGTDDANLHYEGVSLSELGAQPLPIRAPGGGDGAPAKAGPAPPVPGAGG